MGALLLKELQALAKKFCSGSTERASPQNELSGFCPPHKGLIAVEAGMSLLALRGLELQLKVGPGIGGVSRWGLATGSVEDLHALPVFIEPCCLSALPHTPGLMLGAAPGKHLTTFTGHIHRASGVRTLVMQVTREEVGVPHEEPNSLKLLGHWTGACAKVTDLGACILGKLSGHLPRPLHRPLT